MLEGNVQMLAVASRVLKPATIQEVMKEPFNQYGWKILDRWAMNSPERLKALEAEGMIPLISRLWEQQETEQQILTEALGQANYMTETEILMVHQVQTELS